MADPMRAAMLVAIAAGLIAGCAPKPAAKPAAAGDQAGADARAADAVPDSPAAAAFANVREPVDSPDSIKLFFGAWRVAEARAAPYHDGPAPSPDPDLIDRTVAIGASAVSGSPLLACAQPDYSAAKVPPGFLFEGNLAHPDEDAARLGFTGDEIVSLSEGCAGKDGDVEFDFAMIDADTILLDHGAMLYTLKRVRR